MSEQAISANQLIQGITYFGPLAIIIWNAAITHYKVKKNKEDIDKVGIKVDDVVNSLKAENTELLLRFNLATNQITELITSMSHVRKDMEELKSDMKGMMKKTN